MELNISLERHLVISYGDLENYVTLKHDDGDGEVVFLLSYRRLTVLVNKVMYIVDVDDGEC